VESNGGRAAERVILEQPALVILDLMLPGLNGLEVCRRVRSRYAGGIVMLTASKTQANEVDGLELGADDYVVKPVEPRILLARVRGVLRRLRKEVPQLVEPQELEVARLTLRRERREVWVDRNPVELTMMEYDILWLLASRAGEAVSREELFLRVRAVPYDALDRGLDVHVSRLRRKLESAGFDPSLLRSVRGLGYLLVRA
jgi:two-component system response regulator RstA